jgi:hypothetical protein
MVDSCKCARCAAPFIPTRPQLNWLRREASAKVYCGPECRNAGRAESKSHLVPIQHNCNQCGTEFTLNGGQSWKLRTGKATKFCCSRVCASRAIASRPGFLGLQNTEAARQKAEASHAARLLPEVQAECGHCKITFTLPKAARSELRAGRQSIFYCGKTCRSKAVIALPGHQQRMVTAASEKRRSFDFLNTPDAIAKRTDALKASGKLAGGLAVGREAPVPQAMLAEALGRPMEHKVLSRLPRSAGFKACYHIDIAIPEHKIAIEVDGPDHQWRREIDLKKEGVLKRLGWRVVRFTNQQVMHDLAGCVQAVHEVQAQALAG